MTKYTVAALLAFGLIGNASADNSVIESLKVAVTNQSTTPWISMPRNDVVAPKLVSDTVDRDLKTTEAKVKIELLESLSRTVSEFTPTI